MTYQRNIWGALRDRLEDGLDEGAPDGVEEGQVAAREDDEPEDHGSGLTDVAAVGPLDPAQLVDAVAEEGDDPTALTLVLVLVGDGAAAAADRRVALGLVGRALEVVVLEL